MERQRGGLVIASSGLFAVVSAFTRGGEEAGSGPKCVPSPPGLVGWWPGNGSASDLVGGRVATLHGDATFGPGLVGQAFVLDGVSGCSRRHPRVGLRSGFFLNGRVDEVKLVIGLALSNREIRAIVEIEASGKRC